MFMKSISGYNEKKITQWGLLLIVIMALSIDCSFQEPIISPVLQEKEQIITPGDDVIDVDAYTLHKINTLIQNISNKKHLSQSEQLSMISAKFLGTPYQSNHLHGSENTREKLIVDFRGLDCFTYLDYVITLQKSHSQQDFFKNIVSTRYIDSEISFYKRKHFFTDWANRELKIADDITAQLSPFTITQTKLLNKKTNDKQYLAGVSIVSRNIVYIPGRAVDTYLVSQLRSGDLIGIYTPLAGLDVSHTGIFIMTPHGPVLRHVSSYKETQSVIDSPFIPYVSKKAGIIILRVKESLS